MISKRIRIYLILTVAGVAVLLIGYFSFRYFAPFGKQVSYRYPLTIANTENATVYTPVKENVMKIPTQILRTSQSRFSLKPLSSDISSIDAKIKFKSGVREIKLGVRGNENDPFVYQPFYNSFLQYLSWSKVQENGITLWQKNKQFFRISDFFDAVPPGKKIAMYYFDREKIPQKAADASGKGSTVISSMLRGSHSLLVDVSQPPLVITVTKQDLNLYPGEDKVRIDVKKNGKTVTTKTIPDDGSAEASGLKMLPQSATVELNGIPAGIYDVDLVYDGAQGSDSLVTKLEINQRKVVFRDSVFILGTTPTSTWTDSPAIKMLTYHDTSLQTVKLDDTYDLKVDKVLADTEYNLQKTASGLPGKLYKLVSPKNDLLITAKGGYFAFSRDAFFNPDIVSGTDLTAMDKPEDADYILSSYTKAMTDGDWLVSEIRFDPKDIRMSGDKVYFSLEIPDLEKFGGELEIESLEINVKSNGVLSKAAGRENPITKEYPAASPSSGIGGWIAGIRQRLAGFADTLFHGTSEQKRSVSMLHSVTPTLSPSPSVFLTSIAPKRTSLSPTRPVSPTPASYSLLVRVLNGGAEKGTAASAAAVLRSNGFMNVMADNADRTDYTGNTLRFRAEDSGIADRIETVLLKQFGNITRTPVSTTAAEAVLILGKK